MYKTDSDSVTQSDTSPRLALRNTRQCLGGRVELSKPFLSSPFPYTHRFIHGHCLACVVLGMEPRVLGVLGWCSATQLYPSPAFFEFSFVLFCFGVD